MTASSCFKKSSFFGLGPFGKAHGQDPYAIWHYFLARASLALLGIVILEEEEVRSRERVVKCL